MTFDNLISGILILICILTLPIFGMFLNTPSSPSTKNPVVKQWHQSLQRIGKVIDEKALDNIYLCHHSKDKEQVPFEVFFTRRDFQLLLSYLYPNTVWDEHNDGYYDSGVQTNSLESAVYVEELLAYLKKIKDSKRLVGNKKNKANWSSKMTSKWEMLDKEEREAKANIKAILYVRPIDIYGDEFILSFSNEAMLSEEERLKLVDENMKNAKPTKLDVVSEGKISITSPALIELNEFLNENQLPEEVEEELTETMRQIKEKLTLEADAKDVENVLLQASVLNTTAKDFHKIS